MPSPRGTGLVLLAALSLAGRAEAQQGPWVAVETVASQGELFDTRVVKWRIRRAVPQSMVLEEIRSA